MAEFPPQTLLLVDGHACAYRSFFAIRSLTGPAGEPTNAIFGFAKSIMRLRVDLQPTHEAVIWDGGLAAERLASLPAYKAQRPPMPDNLRRQLDPIGEWIVASGGRSLLQEGVEADDWIATQAARAVQAGLRVVIASSDKDFMQLVGPAVRLANPNDKIGELWGVERVRAKTGVHPDQIVDWLSLVGDSVDNIPGVPGVGTKTAATLLAQFGNCEQLLARVNEVASARLREALASSASIVRRNQALVRLHTTLPCAVDVETLERGRGDASRLRALAIRWGFKPATLGASEGSELGQTEMF